MNTPSFLEKAPAIDTPILDHKPGSVTVFIFITVLILGVSIAAYSLTRDIYDAGSLALTWLPYILLGVALSIALGFEFVNGFHDTANAVATVIYTNSLPANIAVLWSGLFNFLGVLFSSGAVAFGIISLLPVELMLQMGSGAGFAMVFALLIAAIIWNLATWYLGLPASSSHTLIGSIIGVGVANALLHGRTGTAGVDWAQASKVGYSLLCSPLIGFCVSALLLIIFRVLIKNQDLFNVPKDNNPPPIWIRGLLILTCTGVSFAHGSNDGQKGMGLIMLILVGTVPMAYALNRAMPIEHVAQFVSNAHITQATLQKNTSISISESSRSELSLFIRTKNFEPAVISALAEVVGDIGEQVNLYGSLSHVPIEAVNNVRNDMYLTSETIKLLEKNDKVNFDVETKANLKTFKKDLDDATKFIPIWVKISVAIALGLGTMVGWKRIVITVGEKIGKSHLTYAQGASAELVAMMTIGAADMFGLPVSTTQVLSSGVAGAMAANKSGLQLETIKRLLMAWVLTLPSAMLLSGSLYWLFLQFA